MLSALKLERQFYKRDAPKFFFPLSPCVLGEAIPRDGSCFLEVDTALILLASTETDVHV
jgi:hypothetical protein